MKNPLFLWLLLPPALLLCLSSLAVAVLLFSVMPVWVNAAAVVLVLVVALWFVFGRRGSSKNIAGSESSLLGRQSSKEGLL